MTIGGEHLHQTLNDPARQRETLERLYHRLGDPIFRYFCRQGCDRDEARDLKQEVFTEAARSLARFRGEATLETWIFSIAKHVWSKRQRAQRRKKRQGVLVPLERPSAEGDRPALDLPAVEESPLEAAERSEESALLRRELQGMPKTMRQCTLLYLNQGLHYREIASLLQIPVGTAKSHVSRAKTRLKELFSNRQPKIPPEESP